MSEFLSEKEQIEELKGWWRENGRFVLTGLVLGAALLFGWNAWKRYETTRETLASESYDALFIAAQRGDLELARRLADELREDYAGTAYAGQAGLALAKAHVDAGQLEDAAAELARVVADADDEILVHIARLRLATLRLSLGQHADALKLLDVAEPGAFAAAYENVRGDLHRAMGELDAARAAYRLALADSTSGVIDREFVQMKLDSLAEAVTGQATPSEEAAAAEAVE